MCGEKRNGGDSRGRRGEVNDGYRKHNQMKGNEKMVRKRMEGIWKREMAGVVANNKMGEKMMREK